MGVPMGVNSRRNDLPIEKRLGWDGAVAVALSLFIAIFFVVGFWDVAIRTLNWLAK